MKTQPNKFDSFEQLSVWTPYGGLMETLHNGFNGTDCPFVEADIWTQEEDVPGDWRTLKQICITQAQIWESLRRPGVHLPTKFTITAQRHSFILTCYVRVAARLPEETCHGWVLLLEGGLERARSQPKHTDDVSTHTVRIASYYDTRSGTGFGLLPKLAMYAL